MHEVLAHAAALTGLVAALVAPGHALERAWLRGADLAGLRALARVALGCAVWMLALFAFAAIGLLRPVPIACLAGSFFALAAWTQWRWRDTSRREPLGLGFLAAAALLCAPFWLRALDYSVAWDAGAYHLMLPKRYLAAGGFTPLPLNVYAIWPHATELLFALAMLLRNYALATALHCVFGVLAIWAVYCACCAAGRPAAGWLAAPLVLANPVFAFELGIAYVDLAFAFFFTASVVFAARALRSPEIDRGALALAGVCAAALSGIKLSGVLGNAAIGALFLPRAIALLRAGRPRAVLAIALCFALPWALLGLPWSVRSAIATGNPVYPFLHDVFGGPDWSAALGAQLDAWLRGMGMGRAALDYALLPLRVVLEGGPDYAHFGGRLAAHWLLLVPLAALFGRREPLVRAALAASGAYFVLWALGSQQMRFLIPVLPPLALAAALTLDLAIERLVPREPAGLSRALRVGVCLVALVAALATTRAHYEAAFAALQSLRVAPQARQLAAADPVYRFVATLPRDAKLVLLDTNQSFFLERDALADSFFEASQLAEWLRAPDPESVQERLAARGITHVLRDTRRDWGTQWPPALLALLDDETRARSRYRSPDGRVAVYELVLR